jgi:hypothetical protein
MPTKAFNVYVDVYMFSTLPLTYSSNISYPHLELGLSMLLNFLVSHQNSAYIFVLSHMCHMPHLLLTIYVFLKIFDYKYVGESIIIRTKDTTFISIKMENL